MTIYTFDKVTELLTELNLETVYHAKREPHIKSKYPDIHQAVYDTTSFLVKPTFTERLFYYANGVTSIEQIPECKWCGKPVNYSIQARAFNDFCSSNTGCGFKYFNEQHGVASASQLPWVQDKVKVNSLAKYGVDSPNKDPAIRKKNSDAHLALADRAIVDLVDNLGFEDLNLTQEEYYLAVDRITEWSYARNIDEIDPDRLRSRTVHLDHIVSIFYGFQNHISPAIIGDRLNLRMLDERSNMSKSYKNAMTIHELLDKYNTFYETNTKPPLTEDFRIPNNRSRSGKRKKMSSTVRAVHTEEVGVCQFCGGEAHYKRKGDGSYQCTPQKKNCPANKAKYAERGKLRYKQRYVSKKKPKV